MNECKTCENHSPHVSKCIGDNCYCKYFPYELPYPHKIDMKKRPKHEESHNTAHENAHGD